MTDVNVFVVSDGDFESQVLKSSVPVLVDFYADWCGPCQMIAPTMESLSKEYSGRVKFVKINVDNNQETSSKYEIMGIPTAILFQNGQIKDSLIGAYPASIYRDRLDRVLKLHYAG